MKEGEWVPYALAVAGFVVMLAGVLTINFTLSSLGRPVFAAGLIMIIIGGVWGALVYKWDLGNP
ncbi:MAG: hypothetical protein AB7S97_05520 [Thermoplasmata archaeon]